MSSSNDWLPFLDARSDSSASEVNTELLHADTPLMPSTSRSKTSPPRSILAPAPMLEVETDSLVSIEMSIPYYNMLNYGGSFDTVDMLHGRTQANMLTESHGQTSGSADTSSPKYANTSHFSRDLRAKPFEAAEVDQVPPQFSQFIVDQNNLATEPALSMIKHSRDILDSMGSQATIFSTRLDGQLTLRSRLKSKSRRLRAFPELSSVHLLTRQKAIRAKEGSLAYRFKLRMRKIVARLRKKFAPVWNYVARLKKATSTVERPTKSRKFGFPKRLRFTVRRLTISPPVNNPNLGHGTSKKGDDVDDRYKSRSSARIDAQLSDFITQQPHTGGSQTFLVESSAPPPPPHMDTLDLDQYLNNSQNSAQLERERVQTAWKQYLSGVVAQRIKLRQEIALFQMLLANQSLPLFYKKHHADIASSHNASLDHVDHGKRLMSTSSTSESMVLIPDSAHLDDDLSAPEIESGTETLDSSEIKLQRVLNRRSMLGEMLDYDSDSQLSLSGSVYLASAGLPLQTRYGTIRRHANTETSSRYLEALNMPRSHELRNLQVP